MGRLFVALLLATLGKAQDEAAQRDALLRAFRAVEDPKAAGFADLDAVAVELRTLHERAASLPAGKRERTRFFIGVREAEVRLRQGRLDDAARLGLAVRAQAQADGVYAGGYRAQLVVQLEQCVDVAALRGLLAEERAFLTDAAAQTDAPWLALPIALLRAQIAFQDGDDARGMQALEACAEQALRELPRDDAWRTKCVGRLAWEFVVRQDLSRAEVYLKELPPEIAAYPRGLVALRRGDFDLALRAGKALQRSGRTVHGLLLQGEAHERAGRFDDARASYADLLAAAVEPLDRAIALRSLGDCELALDTADGVAAEARYREALGLLLGDRHAVAERVQVQARLGDALARQGRRDDARVAYRASLAEVDAARHGAVFDVFGGSWLAAESLRAIEGLLAIWDATAGDAHAALAMLEIGKARTLLDWSAHPPRAGGDALAFAVRAVALTADPTALDAQLRALEDARRRGEAQSVASETPLDASGLRDVTAREPSALFLSYWLGKRTAFLVVSAGGSSDSPGVIALGATADLLPMLARARAAVTDDAAGDPWPALDDAAQAFVPASVHALVRDAERIVFCPDDHLGALPFEALRIGGVPLGVGKAVEHAPSLSLRARLASRIARGDGLAIVDSIEAPEDERRLALPALRFSQREAELVAQAYGGTTARVRGAAATREAVARLLAAGRFDVVHVSAHAVEDRRVPTASLLLLADGPSALPSLVDIPLDGALLVLSACSSANGESRSGEGELGLLGWPVAAGARGAVASLWPVDQQATSDLMAQFHAFRAQGHGAAEAMRRAREVLAAAPNYAHPRHWAGFAVHGGDGSPATSSDLRWYLALAAGVVLVVLVSRSRRR